MTRTGTIKNGVVVSDDPLEFPDGTRVEVRESQGPNSLAKALLALAESCEDFDLPEDYAAQHDHYLHGTPKQ